MNSNLDTMYWVEEFENLENNNINNNQSIGMNITPSIDELNNIKSNLYSQNQQSLNYDSSSNDNVNLTKYLNGIQVNFNDYNYYNQNKRFSTDNSFSSNSPSPCSIINDNNNNNTSKTNSISSNSSLFTDCSSNTDLFDELNSDNNINNNNNNNKTPMINKTIKKQIINKKKQIKSKKSTTATINKSPNLLSPPKKKHNEIEKRYRMNINYKIAKLMNLIPNSNKNINFTTTTATTINLENGNNNNNLSSSPSDEFDQPCSKKDKLNKSQILDMANEYFNNLINEYNKLKVINELNEVKISVLEKQINQNNSN